MRSVQEEAQVGEEERMCWCGSTGDAGDAMRVTRSREAKVVERATASAEWPKGSGGGTR